MYINIHFSYTFEYIYLRQTIILKRSHFVVTCLMRVCVCVCQRQFWESFSAMQTKEPTVPLIRRTANPSSVWAASGVLSRYD